MALTVADFQASFPEFSDADPALITPHLNYAVTRTPASVWGALQEEAAFVRCAQALCLSPYARKMATVDAKDGGATPYDVRLQRLIATLPRWFVT